MFLKKRKGFTLVELLAVIVILGVIALITVPLTGQVMLNARRKAIENSAEALLRETSLQEAMNKIGDNVDISITDSRLNISDNPFISGIIRRNDDGDLELENATDGEFCVNGTSGHLIIEDGACVIEDDTPPELEVQPGYIGATEAVVIAIGKDEESGIRGYEFKLEDDEEYSPMQPENYYQFEDLERGTTYTVIVRVTNGVGLTTEKSVEFTTKNISPATFVVSEPNKWTQSKDVQIIYPARIDGVEYRYKVGENDEWHTLTSGTTTTVTVTENNTMVYAEVILESEKAPSSILVTHIDREPPQVEVEVTPDPDSWSREKTIIIRANDMPSGEGGKDNAGIAEEGYSFNEGATWTKATTLTSTKEDTYEIRVRDNAGNIASATVVIDKIDRIAPTCASAGGSETWTNQSVTLTGTCTDNGGGSGCREQVITSTIDNEMSGTATPGTVSDLAGNTTACPTQEVHIDKTPPTCEVEGGTIENGLIQIEVNKATILIGKCNDTGSGCATGNMRQTVSTSTLGNVLIGTMRDRAGNTADCTVNVVEGDNPDPGTDTTPPECPVFTANVEPETWTNKKVEITITPSEDTESWVWETNRSTTTGENAVWRTWGANIGTQVKTLQELHKSSDSVDSQVRQGRVIVSDAHGNSRTCYTPVYYIDQTAPSCPTFKADTAAKKWTNKDQVNITITPTADTESWTWYTNNPGKSKWNKWQTETTKATKGISTEGKRQGKVIVRDELGNERECKTSEYWLDRTPPYTPVITKIVYPKSGNFSGHYTTSGITTGKILTDRTVTFKAKNGYCSDYTQESWKFYGDQPLPGSPEGSNITLEIKYSCTGKNCYISVDGDKKKSITSWTNVGYPWKISMYAGDTRSSSTFQVRATDGANNKSKVLTYKTNWCV